MRAIRLAISALEDIERQLGPYRAQEFRHLDLTPVLEAIAADQAVWATMTSAHGPGRRLTVEGVTVAGFHLFGADDPDDPRPGAIVIYFIDIWDDSFPD